MSREKTERKREQPDLTLFGFCLVRKDGSARQATYGDVAGQHQLVYPGDRDLRIKSRCEKKGGQGGGLGQGSIL